MAKVLHEVASTDQREVMVRDHRIVKPGSSGRTLLWVQPKSAAEVPVDLSSATDLLLIVKASRGQRVSFLQQKYATQSHCNWDRRTI